MIGWVVGFGQEAVAADGQQVLVVKSSPVGASTTLGGTVVPFREVAFSAQMPGRIEHISGVEGDWFRRGTTLVALNSENLLAKRQAAQANLSKARAAYRNARVQYTRQVYSGSQMASDNMGMDMPRLFDRVFTRPAADMAGVDNPELTRRAQIYAQGTQIDQAKYGMIQAQAQLRELDASLRDTRSIAPFSGVIVAKHIEVGDTVQPGMPLLSFADTRHLQIKVEIPARLMPGVKKGMILSAKLDVGKARVDTRVAQIFPMADPQRHTVTVKLDLPKGSPGGPGMYAEVMIPDITSPEKNLPTIPKSAVIWRGSLPAVTVVVGEGRTEQRLVRLGGLVGEDLISILSGLRVGEKILAVGASHTTSTWSGAKTTMDGSEDPATTY
ncbi:MAG: efflux RND transporter periplasmic adaptor subunit [Magnetococcales bacterium]|nr:efflux RND transporter periplasmic adaptor subunit [Magnetococcales bacterium]